MTLHEKRIAKSSISECNAQDEIQKFVKAVSSYAAHFATNPMITFEEHLMLLSKQPEKNSGD
jgi:hypothetical protein